MTTNYEPYPTNHPTVTMPSDGDPANAASLLCVQQAADLARNERARRKTTMLANAGGAHFVTTTDDVYAVAAGKYDNYAGIGMATYHLGVCDGGKMKYSYDQMRTVSSFNAAAAYASTFRSVAYMRNVNLHVAVGNAGEIQSIAAPSTPTRRNTDATIVFYKVIYVHSLGMAVAVGIGATAGIIYTSTDGATWLSRAVPAGVTALYDLIWDGTRLLAVGFDGTDGVVIKSTDGIAWSTEATLTGRGELTKIAHASRIGAYFVVEGARYVHKSINRTSWTEVLDLGTGGTGSEIFALVAWTDIVAVVIYPFTFGTSSAYMRVSTLGDSGSWKFTRGVDGLLATKDGHGTVDLVPLRADVDTPDAYFATFGLSSGQLAFTEFETEV